ncbi:MAG: uracil-DNA glycosylase, partial [Spirochaetaceae bacterium]|nr:uracil-DNA glycosylase [Spirochaetaceae bacterium]
AARAAEARAGGGGPAEPARRRARRAAAAPGDSLELVAREVGSCEACRLSGGRRLAVPGEGAARPLVLVVGEGPGAEEDQSGRPFVGPAGQLLDKMLAAIGLSRAENCYIANMVKCRPPMNRDPAPDETNACLGYLRRQAALLQPFAILCVGRIAAQNLLGTSEGIGRLRGRFFEWEGIPLFATYHPSAILRDEGLKRPAWEDLKAFKAYLDGEAAPSGAAGGLPGGPSGGESR